MSSLFSVEPSPTYLTSSLTLSDGIVSNGTFSFPCAAEDISSVTSSGGGKHLFTTRNGMLYLLDDSGSCLENRKIPAGSKATMSASSILVYDGRSVATLPMPPNSESLPASERHFDEAVLSVTPFAVVTSKTIQLANSPSINHGLSDVCCAASSASFVCLASASSVVCFPLGAAPTPSTIDLHNVRSMDLLDDTLAVLSATALHVFSLSVSESPALILQAPLQLPGPLPSPPVGSAGFTSLPNPVLLSSTKVFAASPRGPQTFDYTENEAMLKEIGAMLNEKNYDQITSLLSPKFSADTCPPYLHPSTFAASRILDALAGNGASAEENVSSVSSELRVLFSSIISTPAIAVPCLESITEGVVSTMNGCSKSEATEKALVVKDAMSKAGLSYRVRCFTPLGSEPPHPTIAPPPLTGPCHLP